MKRPIPGGIAAWLFIAFAGYALAGPAFSAQYPSGPLRLVVPFPPGGAGDFQARTFGPRLGEQLRQPLLIDNRPGANGAVALELVARGSADGHTLLLGFGSAFTINPALYSKLSYDPVRDFAAISMIARTTHALVANPAFPASSVKELIALAKAAPGKITYGSPGIGNANHLAGELLSWKTGIELVHVPYKGAAPVMIDVIGGRVPIAFVTVTAALPHVRAGKVKALVVTGKQRAIAMPDTPTASEVALPDLELVNGWFGILAHARTQKAVIARLNEEIVKVMHAPEVHERFVGEGLQPTTTTPDEFAAVIKSDLGKWAKVIQQAGIRVE